MEIPLDPNFGILNCDYTPILNSRRVKDFISLRGLFTASINDPKSIYRIPSGYYTFYELLALMEANCNDVIDEPFLAFWEMTARTRESNKESLKERLKDPKYRSKFINTILYKNEHSFTCMLKREWVTTPKRIWHFTISGVGQYSITINVTFLSIVEYMILYIWSQKGIDLVTEFNKFLDCMGTTEGYVRLTLANLYLKDDVPNLSDYYYKYGGSPSDICNYGLEI